MFKGDLDRCSALKQRAQDSSKPKQDFSAIYN
uniref:Uncharacterized protein n=1 Tax=Anguilla anguilla TaxID=7936 RepID=A0A0E9UY89_ANGAN